MSSHTPAHMARKVRDRANDCCEYCHLSQEWQEATFHIDHVKPKTAGGKTALNNLALLESKAAHWETAEQLAQQAITLQARPEFVDTQVEILIMQNRQAEALDVLSRNLKRWPGHASLMARYSALKKSEDERIRKSEAAAG